jgi:hypothetical protein
VRAAQAEPGLRRAVERAAREAGERAGRRGGVGLVELLRERGYTVERAR